MLTGAVADYVMGGTINETMVALRGGSTLDIQAAFLQGALKGMSWGAAFGLAGAYAQMYRKARLVPASVHLRLYSNSISDISPLKT